MRKCWQIANCRMEKQISCPAAQSGKSCWSIRKCRNCQNVENPEDCPVFQQHRDELMRLVNRAQKGDEIAMNELITEFSGYVFQAEKRYFIPGSTREDLHQEGFIGLFTAIKTYDASRNMSLEDYISLSIRNAIIRAVRSATQKKQLLLTNADSLETDTNAYVRLQSQKRELEEIVLGKLQAEQIDDIINYYLSRSEKKILKLRLEDYSVDEIADIVNEDRKTVENALYRARKKIKAYVSDENALRELKYLEGSKENNELASTFIN
ncbi:MAG: sigma-70 family RNA polymerase sigma factor [Firmicutes bacterium]|nr:sigma-70 family RNA polymerase sigma factor [Bacillota bacterium]